MFTGIIESVGEIESLEQINGDLRIRVGTGRLEMSGVQLGDSIATNGVCLTVVEFGPQYFIADVSQETLEHSRLREMQIREPVNLEQALLPTTRLGGHLVSGHVDGLAEIKEMKSDARSVRMLLSLPRSIAHLVASKGSITIDGVSLTVNSVNNLEFEVNLVPHTAANTIIQYYEPGRWVHIEVDMIARYLDRLLNFDDQQQNQATGVTMDLLAKSGYLR